MQKGVKPVRSKKKVIIGVCAAAVILAVVLCAVLLPGKEEKLYAMSAQQGGQAREKTYQAYLAENGYEDQVSSARAEVDVFAWQAEDAAQAENGQDGVLTGDAGMITWPFTVQEAGFYHLKVGYIGLPGTTSDIQRRVLLDGDAPYNALNQIVFKRLWRDEDIRLKNENEIRPNAEEVYQAQSVYLEDYDRRSGAPLLFYLSAGEHTLSFEAVKEPMEITSLSFEAAPAAPAYAEALAGWQAAGILPLPEPLSGTASFPAFTMPSAMPKRLPRRWTKASRNLSAFPFLQTTQSR